MTKNVLITGGAGFIAHHVIKAIIDQTDWNITCLDRLDYSGNLNRIDEILTGYTKEDKKRVRILFHDLRAEINPLVKSRIGKQDIILHLAASTHVDRSITDPMSFIHDNILGTAHLLEFARTVDYKLERFLYFSTDEIFGPAPPGVSYKERDRYNSTNPYSASKAAGEELCVAYENTFKIPMVITHTMNVFGERQTPEKFIPMCIKKVRDGEKIFIHSDSSKTLPGSRFYIHAADVADAILHILTKVDLDSVEKDFGNAKCPKFNVVGKEEIDNLELAQMIAEAQNKELNYEMIDFHSSRPGHDLRYALSGELLKSLGWEPRISLKERIKQVVDWSLKNAQWVDL